MTHHDAWVLFPSDGTLMHAEYDGTADQILTPLYSTYEACHAAWRSGAKAVCSCGRTEHALYAESYGGGSHGPILACRYCKAITCTTAFDPDGLGYASGPFEGVPDWVLAYLTSPTRHCLQGLLPQASEPLIAGGWLRDLINDDEPHDIDVFIAADTYDDMIEHVSKEARDSSWSLQELEVGNAGTTVSHPSAGEDVMRVYEIRGLCAWPVQLIEVPDPLAWVRSFDAYCNMIVLPVFGDEPVRAISSLAMQHARERIFEINPLARESDEVLKGREQKFAARGYNVRLGEAWLMRERPGLDSIDLQAALDTVNA